MKKRVSVAALIVISGLAAACGGGGGGAGTAMSPLPPAQITPPLTSTGAAFTLSGGAALRLETGDDNSNLAGPDIGGVHDIYAENVSCTTGQTALTLSPHNKLNGKIVVRNISADDCAPGVNIAAGFINIGLRDNPDITPGAFVVRPTILNVNVNRTIGEQKATIKFKDFNRIPENLRGGLSNTDLPGSGDNDSKLFDPVVPVAALSMLSLENPGPMEDGYYGVIIDADDVTSYADTDPIRDEFYFDVPD